MLTIFATDPLLIVSVEVLLGVVVVVEPLDSDVPLGDKVSHLSDSSEIASSDMADVGLQVPEETGVEPELASIDEGG